VHTLLYAAAALLIGYQAVLFAIFSKVFAIGAGLMPEDQRLSRMTRVIRLEAGLAIGALLIAAGLAGSLYAVGLWRSTSYGPLSPSQVLRLVIPSVTAMILGFETILGSFFLSVLALVRK
jgi:hypothetical protein